MIVMDAVPQLLVFRESWSKTKLFSRVVVKVAELIVVLQVRFVILTI